MHSRDENDDGKRESLGERLQRGCHESGCMCWSEISESVWECIEAFVT
jgi:hypothetical protein